MIFSNKNDGRSENANNREFLEKLDRETDPKFLRKLEFHMRTPRQLLRTSTWNSEIDIPTASSTPDDTLQHLMIFSDQSSRHDVDDKHRILKRQTTLNCEIRRQEPKISSFIVNHQLPQSTNCLSIISQTSNQKTEFDDKSFPDHQHSIS